MIGTLRGDDRLVASTGSATIIAFGCAVTNEEKYERFARPGLALVAEPDSPILSRRGLSLQGAYNAMLDELSEHADLEAAVLIHQDVEIDDPALLAKLRVWLPGSNVAIVGAYGAADVRSLAYWEGTPLGRVWGPSVGPRGRELGEGYQPPRGEADAVDGLLMALSPWAVRNLRFDTSFEPVFHGYDIDYCFQALAAGREVRVEHMRVIHHAQAGFFDRDRWVQAELLFQRKWRMSASLRSAT